MIYIETNEKSVITSKHYMPFDENYGLKKTKEELELTGFIVEEIPEMPSAPFGYRTIEKYSNEEGFTYEYEEAKKTQEEKIFELMKTKEEIFEDYKNNPSTLVEELKNAKHEALKEQCTQAIYDGFRSTTIGKSFGFNDHDQNNFTQQLLIIVAAGGNYTLPIKWKALDGSVNELTSEQFQALIGEATAHKISNQEKFWALEQQLLAATTKEEIIAIEW